MFLSVAFHPPLNSVGICLVVNFYGGIQATFKVRNMLSRSHYHFAQHLTQMALRRGVLVVRLSEEEAYTSKTRGKCGHIHTSLGGSKSFNCPRDVNGARNIILLALQAVALTISDSDAVPISMLYLSDLDRLKTAFPAKKLHNQLSP
jgi:hypothetical protein